MFLQYADSIRHGLLPELLPWAKEYPPGLFIIASPLLIAGVPVDALIGWIWNCVPVILMCIFAFVTSKREGIAVGIALLLIGLLSQAYYDGFFAMYYKAYVALLMVVLTYHFAEKYSFWCIPLALAAVMIHQQTAIILILSLAIWWILALRTQWSNLKFRVFTITMCSAAVLAVFWYIPQWERAIWSPLKSIFLLRGAAAPAGAFPDALFYLRTMGIIVILGISGFIVSLRKQRGSLWQISVIICAIFIVFRLVFYKRFFLQFDFFLMPFAAIALVELWQRYSVAWIRICIIVALLAQTIVSISIVLKRVPLIQPNDVETILSLSEHIEPDATVIALENTSGTWLRGWLPYHTVGAPGLFDIPNWSYQQWEQFIQGTEQERKALLKTLKSPVYFYLTPAFMLYYGAEAGIVVEDPCLQLLDTAPLLRSLCSE